VVHRSTIGQTVGVGTLCGFGLLYVNHPSPGMPRSPDSLAAQPRRVLSGHSDLAEQKQNEQNHEHRADNAHATMAIAVTVAAESATEATQQEDDENDDDDKPEGHGVISIADNARCESAQPNEVLSDV
jgi:hypothetical protein